jgi:pimeloyl-ACP methyl ester carboxylesterase
MTYVYRPVKNDRHEVVLFSHGSTGGMARSPSEPGGSNAPSGTVVQFFVSRGYTVVAPMRRGRGESSGTYVEECSVFTGQCTTADQVALSERAIREALLDTDAVVQQLVLGRLTGRDSKILLVGHSRGGFLSLVLAGERPTLVRGVINFSGGWHGVTDRLTSDENKQRMEDHGTRLTRAATRAAVPTMWLYAARDPLYQDGVPQEMLRSWQAGGGRAEFVFLAEHSLANAHLAIGELGLWDKRADAFLKGLETASTTAPR